MTTTDAALWEARVSDEPLRKSPVGEGSRKALFASVCGIASSMKSRVFLAAFAVGLIPLATFVGWGLLLQNDDLNSKWVEIDARSGSVHAAWSTLAANPTVQTMNSLSAMREKLRPDEYRALLSHAVALMESSGNAYTAVRTSIDRIRGAHGLFGSDSRALAQLTRQGYLWGDSTYWYRNPDWDPSRSSEWWNRAPSWMGESMPFVAWMPTKNSVRYLHVVPPILSAPSGVPRSWIAAIIGVMVAIIVGFATVATLLATRGFAKPLKRMAHESELLTAGGSIDEVPVNGPTEVRRAARAFNSMAARLRRAQDTEQQFLLSVSHELKTPLTSIKGYGEALEEDAVSPDEAGRVVAEEAGRMQRLVQDLLDLGRARKSTFSVRREPVDLSAIAREAVRRYQSRAESYHIELRAEVPDDDLPGPCALADGDRVLQVISNLVENAVRCAPAFSSVIVSVGLLPERGRDEAVVQVSDSGLGLQEEELQHAFDRFYLYERYGRERPVGTGLGLAIVKDLAEAMSGRVSVESRPGAGTIFSVVLPRSVATAATAEGHVLERNPGPESAGTIPAR